MFCPRLFLILNFKEIKRYISTRMFSFLSGKENILRITCIHHYVVFLKTGKKISDAVVEGGLQKEYCLKKDIIQSLTVIFMRKAIAIVVFKFFTKNFRALYRKSNVSIFSEQFSIRQKLPEEYCYSIFKKVQQIILIITLASDVLKTKFIFENLDQLQY